MTEQPSLLRRCLCGAAMGIADAVPGVSGGTVALILGVYRHLIAQLAAAVGVARRPWLRSSWEQVPSIIGFLAPLLIMLVITLVLTTRLLVGTPPDVSGLERDAGVALLDQGGGLLVRSTTAPIVFAFFFALVAASITIPLRRRQHHHWHHWLLGGIGALAAASLSLVPPAAGSTHPLALFISGAIAISVMLLPGVSGSLALLVLGMYHPISEAVNRMQIGTIVWVILGVIAGVIVVIPLLNRLLKNAHDATMACLAGLMLGSLIALWPWKTHYAPKQIGEWGTLAPIAPYGAWWWPVLAAGAGLLIIWLLERRSTAGSPT